MRLKYYVVAVTASVLTLVWANVAQADTTTPDKQHLFVGIWKVHFEVQHREQNDSTNVDAILADTNRRLAIMDLNRQHPDNSLTVGFTCG